MSRHPDSRSEREAFAAYISPLQRLLACFACNVTLVRGSLDPRAQAVGLTTALGDPVPLHDEHGTVVLELAIRLYYRTRQISRAPRRWEATTAGYIC